MYYREWCGWQNIIFLRAIFLMRDTITLLYHYIMQCSEIAAGVKKNYCMGKRVDREENCIKNWVKGLLSFWARKKIQKPLYMDGSFFWKMIFPNFNPWWTEHNGAFAKYFGKSVIWQKVGNFNRIDFPRILRPFFFLRKSKKYCLSDTKSP